ncbi:HAD family hydrolase [Dactylosporangium aurantiacum]|uniref:HAD family hydrolase n=1 Tax=Dactylosporangium aurantiacum TaxID=35754 RepID=A0A9Q9IKQ8_9ACTN|nr:HAD family hydrolase [Dactylosporangium aurantiacum]MDG6108448.1 HAD family hydrolase [Dactylosporangium aurantiacum]UWZ57361.1 HAD family hydrolase [Dactylosporangium aurantiacum]
MRTHILFDFFGTLVDYDARRTAQGYPRTYAALTRLGAGVSYAQFLEGWDRTFAGFDAGSEAEDREFSMTQVGTAYLAEVLGRRPGAGEVDAFIGGYLAEWNAGVSYPEGVVSLVRSLSRVYRLAVVTNTHQPDLVPGHLAAMGILDVMDAVVTSVEVGRRKPHPAVYAATVERLGIEPGAAVFVGDTYAADFAGPERFGMTAYLIDPAGRADVPGDRRLRSVLDLPGVLRAAVR